MSQVDDNTIYMGSQDTHIKSFNFDSSLFQPASEPLQDDAVVEEDCCTDNLDSHLSVINSLEICGNYVCSAGGDAMVRVWRLRTLKPVHVLRGHRGSILTIRSIGSILLTGGRDNTIRYINIYVSSRSATSHGTHMSMCS